MQRAQSAMEYLMTYGWAILIIAVVLGALFQLGVFNSSSFSPRAPPGACQVFRPSGPGTTTNINLMGVCTGLLPQYAGQLNGMGYVNLGTAQVLIVTTNDFSITGWVNANSWVGAPVLLQKEDCLSGGRGWYAGFTASGRREASLNDGTQGVYTNVGSLLSLNRWYHVAYVFSRSSTLKAYIDGVADGSADISARSASLTNTYSAYIGTYVCGVPNGKYFSGTLANIQFYNTSLTANEVQALYLEGVGGAPLPIQNLGGWWPLNGNANDYSGNNNNGVPTNVVFTTQYGK